MGRLKIAIKDGMVWIKDAGPAHTATLRKSGRMKGDVRTGMLYGPMSIELLDLIRKEAGLPGPVEELRQALIRTREAVDQERARDAPEPLVEYPVKRTLYMHQVRGANMALLTMGIAEAKEKENGRRENHYEQ